MNVNRRIICLNLVLLLFTFAKSHIIIILVLIKLKMLHFCFVICDRTHPQFEHPDRVLFLSINKAKGLLDEKNLLAKHIVQYQYS